MRPKSGRFACKLATSAIVTLTSGSWMFVMERIRMSFLPEAKSPALGLIELAFLGLADRCVVLPRPRIPSPVHGKGGDYPDACSQQVRRSAPGTGQTTSAFLHW